MIRIRLQYQRSQATLLEVPPF